MKFHNIYRVRQVSAFIFLLFFLPATGLAEARQVVVQEDHDGWRLLLDGKPLMVNGMNWDYFPIGTNNEYIHENYGIYTMLNHSFGRYGLPIDGEWIPNTDYSDSRIMEFLLQEVADLAKEEYDKPVLLTEFGADACERAKGNKKVGSPADGSNY